MRKKKKSCGCNNQTNMYNKNACNSKNVNYCQKKENTCEDKCSCKTKSTECNPKSCIPDKSINTIDSCKPTKCKSKIKEYTCPYQECEIKCEDKCSDLAKRAEELFNKAVKYEEKAMCALKEAKELEQNAKTLSKKSCNLMQNAKQADKGAKDASCSANELMNKAEELCCRAKCLYKEAKDLEKEATENCQNAKCAYEKAENYNEQAKYLYNQTLKYEHKTLECYKTAEEKIKEIGGKSKKCQDLISKCNSKLSNCMDSCVKEEKKNNCNICKKNQADSCNNQIQSDDCSCKSQNNTTSKAKDDSLVWEGYDFNNWDHKNCGCEDEIIQLVPENQDSCDCEYNTNCQYSYVNPMYDMMPMQYMGNISTQYMTLETPYIIPFSEAESTNDMWNNYYMYIQKMIQSMKD